MKNIYSLLFTILGSAAITFAQPTLTTANFTPNVGENQPYNIADTNTVIDNTVGANVTFDYSNMQGYGQSQTQYIVSPASTPFASDFTSATFADTTEGYPINKNYSKVHGTDSITKTGIVADVPGFGTVIGKYSVDSETTMKFPFAYNDIYFDDYAGSFTINSLIPVNTNGAGNVTVNADAWGTLLLPLGVSIDSVLRVKTTEYLKTDTIFGFITVLPVVISGEIINYYKPSVSKFPLLSIVNGSYTQDNNVLDSSRAFICQYPMPTIGVDELNANTSVTVFPNPTNNDITTLSFDTENQANVKVSLLNSLGQNVKTVFNGSLPQGNNKMDIELTGLSKGLYFVNLNINNRQLTTKLLVE